jgi:Protein of unknown function (DUF2865)
VSDRRSDRYRFELCAGAALAVSLVACLSAPAAAAGLFDFLFGGGNSRPAPPPPPPVGGYYTGPQADPRGAYHDSGSLGPAAAGAPLDTGTGRATMFCVRMCDGRYYPIQQHGGASPAQICSAMCPASATQIFYGSSIDQASAPGVGPYTGTRNAYVYRKQLLPNCTCNGKDQFGLVTLDVNSDPTLRAGDVVAMRNGATKTAGGRAANIGLDSGNGIIGPDDTEAGDAPPVQPLPPPARVPARPSTTSRSFTPQ